MSFPKLLGITAILLFGSVGIAAFFKGCKSTSLDRKVLTGPVEIELGREVKVVKPKLVPQPKAVSDPVPAAKAAAPKQAPEALPEANRIAELFNREGAKLPIVETIVYSSRVSWLQGRPAWLADYARHYRTSRHFIARSLNGKPDYLKQEVMEGDRFNILKPDKKIQFYLLVDLSRCKMLFYYDDLDAQERVLLKTYQVGIGRVDGSRASGFRTPLGKYSLGNKVATYQAGSMGHYHGETIEMISVFGTRWIPFDKEISGCTAPAKGLGLHGVPWVHSASGERTQDFSSLGKYQSDGCIRLASQDIEELYAIIISRPSIIEIVKDFYETPKINK